MANMRLSEVQQLAKRGKQALYLASVEKKSKLMQLIGWYPTSDGDVHKGIKVSKLPEGGFVGYNQGIPTSNAATEEYSATTHFYELMSKVDTRFLENKTAEEADAIRHNKDMLYTKGFMQGMAKEIVQGTGKSIDAERGLLERRNKLGPYCLDMGGKTGGSLGSILLVRFDEDGVCLRYPDNAQKGFYLKAKDKPELVQADDGSGEFDAYVTIFRTIYLLDVAMDDALIRLANIPTDKAFDQAMMDKIADAFDEINENYEEQYVALCPKKVMTQFKKYERDKNNVYFTREEFEKMGKVRFIYDIPLFTEGYMTSTEQQITK